MNNPPELILAPVRGITDSLYRDAFACCFGGFDRAVSPFIPLRQGHLSRPAELTQVAPENNRAMKSIPQVLTNHAPTFSAVLQQLHDAGHGEVNWNLGCPYPMVTERIRGAGLLPHPDRIDAILNEVLENSPVQLSVKMRLGYHSPDEYKPVIEVLNRYPIREVTLHARTADQMYDGTVDIKRAAACLAMCRHPFIYNGDITSVRGFRALTEQLPNTSGWMIGRGALTNPFLPPSIKGLSIPDEDGRRKKLRQFHDRLYDGFRERLSGPKHLKDKMLEQWIYLCRIFSNSDQVLTRVRRSYVSRYNDTVNWAFDQPLAGMD